MTSWLTRTCKNEGLLKDKIRSTANTSNYESPPTGQPNGPAKKLASSGSYGIAVNTWRSRIINPTVDTDCLSCNTGAEEGVLHCFWACPQGLWIARNDVVFNHSLWPKTEIEGTIWSSLVDYGRAEWCKLQRKKFKSDAARLEALLHCGLATNTSVSALRVALDGSGLVLIQEGSCVWLGAVRGFAPVPSGLALYYISLHLNSFQFVSKN